MHRPPANDVVLSAARCGALAGPRMAMAPSTSLCAFSAKGVQMSTPRAVAILPFASYVQRTTVWDADMREAHTSSRASSAMGSPNLLRESNEQRLKTST